ncbi:MAG: ABC transporter permease subunit [Potamolinea sp.]
MVFQILAPLQLVLLMFVACLAGCTAVSNEKDKRTLILVLMTTLSNQELVVGKMSAGLLTGINLLFSGILALIVLSLLGGVSPSQVFEVGAIAVATIFASSAWGTMVALWRDKTFQAIAVSLLGLVLYLAISELIATRNAKLPIPGIQGVAELLSPIRTTIVVSRPIPSVASTGRWNLVIGSCATMLILGATFYLLAVARLRIWNPSREGRPKVDEEESESHLDGGGGKAASVSKGWQARQPRRVWITRSCGARCVLGPTVGKCCSFAFRIYCSDR